MPNFRNPDWVFGVDVSVHQGNIDWQRVKDSGIEFAILKTSEGTGFMDPKWPQNRDGARRVGLVYTGYHFARPDSKPGDAVDEARWFMSLGGHLGQFPGALDLESTTMGREETINWGRDFFQEMEDELPQNYLLYAGGFWLGSAIAADPRLRHCWWWLPNYGPGLHDPDPFDLMRRGYPAENNSVGEKHDVYQYTSRGRVDGIPGDVDINIMPRWKYNAILNRQLHNEEIDMNVAELRMEMTGQEDLPVRDVLAKWIGDAKKSTYVILDGRTGKYWAVCGLFRLEIENEAWAGWWSQRADVNAIYSIFGPVIEGPFIAMVDQSVIVRYNDDREFLSAIDGSGITVEADIDTTAISETTANATAERVAQLLENGTMTTEFERG